MYCSIEEAWPTYNYTNNPISRSNGVENFLNNEANDHSIMNKNDMRPQFQTNINSNVNSNLHHNSMRNTEILPFTQENIIMSKENSHNQFNDELLKLKNHFSHNNHSHNNLHNNHLHNKHNTFCSCQDFMYHLQNCEECQNLMHNKFRPSKIEEILSLNPNIKETIVIFLVGILILMILNLFYK